MLGPYPILGSRPDTLRTDKKFQEEIKAGKTTRLHSNLSRTQIIQLIYDLLTSYVSDVRDILRKNHKNKATSLPQVPISPQASLDLLRNPDWTDAEVHAHYLGPTGSLAAAEKHWNQICNLIPVEVFHNYYPTAASAAGLTGPPSAAALSGIPTGTTSAPAPTSTGSSSSLPAGRSSAPTSTSSSSSLPAGSSSTSSSAPASAVLTPLTPALPLGPTRAGSPTLRQIIPPVMHPISNMHFSSPDSSFPRTGRLARAATPASPRPFVPPWAALFAGRANEPGNRSLAMASYLDTLLTSPQRSNAPFVEQSCDANLFASSSALNQTASPIAALIGPPQTPARQPLTPARGTGRPAPAASSSGASTLPTIPEIPAPATIPPATESKAAEDAATIAREEAEREATERAEEVARQLAEEEQEREEEAKQARKEERERERTREREQKAGEGTEDNVCNEGDGEANRLPGQGDNPAGQPQLSAPPAPRSGGSSGDATSSQSSPPRRTTRSSTSGATSGYHMYMLSRPYGSVPARRTMFALSIPTVIPTPDQATFARKFAINYHISNTPIQLAIMHAINNVRSWGDKATVALMEVCWARFVRVTDSIQQVWCSLSLIWLQFTRDLIHGLLDKHDTRKTGYTGSYIGS